MKQKKLVSWDVILLSGIFFVLAGVLLLMVTTGMISQAGSLWPILFIVTGILAGFVVFKRNLKSRFLFLSCLSILLGLFLFLYTLGLVPGSLRHLWPVFPLLIAISILPPGFKRYKSPRAVFIIPSLALFILSSIFLLFSTGLIKLSLRAFVVIWWPLIIVLAGLFLITLYILNRIGIFSKKHTRL